MAWKIELDQDAKLALIEDIGMQMEAFMANEKERLIWNRESKWKVTNISSKSFVVWSVHHPGLRDGHGIKWFVKKRVIAPGESLEIITHQSNIGSRVTLACTEYETVEEARIASEHYQRTNEPYGEYKDSWDDKEGWSAEPVFPLQHCELNLHQEIQEMVWHCAERAGLKNPSSTPVKDSRSLQ